MEKRIHNASSLLDSSLGHCFVDGLTHKDENAVYNCLRAYAAVDNTRNAEEIFRSTVVAPLVQKVIPYTSSGAVGGSIGDELEEDYKQIKHLIAEDCTFLLQISSTGILLVIIFLMPCPFNKGLFNSCHRENFGALCSHLTPFAFLAMVTNSIRSMLEKYKGHFNVIYLS